MDNLKLASLRDRLTQRRDMVAATLRCVEDRMRAFDENTDWKDEITQRSREILLDYLDHWYGREIVQVDEALDRLFQKNYGVCIGCNGAIESERLEQLPETEFCSACHKISQQMARRSGRLLRTVPRPTGTPVGSRRYGHEQASLLQSPNLQ